MSSWQSSELHSSPDVAYSVSESSRSISLNDIPSAMRQRLTSMAAPAFGLPECTIGEERKIHRKNQTDPEKQEGESIENSHSWFMLFTVFLFQSLFGLALFSPPLYMVVFAEYFNIGNLPVSWVGSIYMFCCFSFGIVASPFVGQYGCKKVSLLGSTVMFLARNLSALAPSISVIFLLMSVVSGCGAGSAFIAANVLLQSYFDHHRSLAASFGLTGLGVGMIVAPYLITNLVDIYGWRGAVVLEAAILSHTIPLSLLFTKPKKKTQDSRNDEEDKDNTSTCSHLKNFLKSALDFRMLTDGLFTLYCLSNFMTRMNSSTVTVHLASYLKSKGYTLEEAALVTSISGGSCMVARVVASFLANQTLFNHITLYGLLMLLNASSSLVFLYFEGFTAKCTGAALFGFAFGFDYTFVPTILVQIMGLDRFTRSMAMYNLFSLGLAIITLPAIAGLLYDVFASYDIPLLVGAVGGFGGCLLSFLCAALLARRLRMQ